MSENAEEKKEEVAKSKEEKTVQQGKGPSKSVQEAQAVKSERDTCANCGKKLKRKGGYYRNGKYYCNKRCWRHAQEKIKKL